MLKERFFLKEIETL